MSMLLSPFVPLFSFLTVLTSNFPISAFHFGCLKTIIFFSKQAHIYSFLLNRLHENLLGQSDLEVQRLFGLVCFHTSHSQHFNASLYQMIILEVHKKQKGTCRYFAKNRQKKQWKHCLRFNSYRFYFRNFYLINFIPHVINAVNFLSYFYVAVINSSYSMLDIFLAYGDLVSSHKSYIGSFYFLCPINHSWK